MHQVEELETSLDLPLQLVYMKQLTLLREKALQRYKTLSKGSETSDYQVSRKLSEGCSMLLLESQIRACSGPHGD